MAGTVASLRIGVIIEGGGLKQPWAVLADSVQNVQGRTFFNVSRSDRSFARFLGLNCSNRAPWQGNSTLDYLCNLRNAVLEEWVCDKWGESNGPCADVLPSPNKKARKDIIDEAPEVLEMTIPAQGKSLAAYTLTVLSKAKLSRNDTKYSDAFPDVRVHHRPEWRTWQL